MTQLRTAAQRRCTRVHDLVRLLPDAADTWPDAPAWVRTALRRAPWAVCRRAGGSAGSLAIGVRGARRGERYGTEVPCEAVQATITPEELVVRLDTSDAAPAAAARGVARAMHSHALDWGPTGSLGFELATGSAATNAASDLDAVVRAQGVARDVLDALYAACRTVARQSGVRIDLELSFGDSGIALAEYVGAASTVVAKTPSGPVRIARPA